MKKLNLEGANAIKGEILTRSQLKKILGGTGSGSSQCGPEEYDTPTTWYCCSGGAKYENSTCRQVIDKCAGILTNDLSRC